MTSKINDVKSAIREIISRELQLDPQIITDDVRLRDVPGIESLKFLRIVLQVEAHYSVELGEQVVFSIDTIEDMAAEVVNLLDQELQVAGGSRHA